MSAANLIEINVDRLLENVSAALIKSSLVRLEFWQRNVLNEPFENESTAKSWKVF